MHNSSSLPKNTPLHIQVSINILKLIHNILFFVREQRGEEFTERLRRGEFEQQVHRRRTGRRPTQVVLEPNALGKHVLNQNGAICNVSQNIQNQYTNCKNAK
jgi:hypothetical protein